MKTYLIATLIFIVFFLPSLSVTIIDAGEVGVKKLFGKVDNEVLPSGFHFVNPFTKVIRFDIKTQNYTMTVEKSVDNEEQSDAIPVLSADGLEVILDLTVLYRLNPGKAPEILETIGEDYTNVIIRPVCRTRLRDAAVRYDAGSLYASKREEFQGFIFNSIETDFKARGIELESILVRNITLPKSVRETIESKINAEQEAQKMIFVLQKERQMAEQKRIEAQGIADYQAIVSKTLNNNLLQFEKIKALQLAATNAKLIITDMNKNTPLIFDSK